MNFSRYFEHHRLDELNVKGAFGIYVHVPFCMRRCRYCAFVSSVLRPVPSETYIQSLCREYALRRPAFCGTHLTTLYLGGGTPTMLEDRDIEKLIRCIVERDGMPDEMTLEVNPEHVTKERAENWKSIGITRVSLGIQSFQNEMLQMLGRRHSAEQAIQAIDILRHTGLDEISVDLIYGAHLPSILSKCDEIQRWRYELEVVKSIEPAHLSCYELTLEENTPLWTLQKRSRNVICEEDLLLEMMHLIPDVTGMPQYEISNYGRGQFMSLHNLSCWAGVPYLGLGPGAHSLYRNDAEIVRRANANNVRAWMDAAQKGEASPEPLFVEKLTPQTHLAERLMCAARTRICWSPTAIAESLNTSLAPFRPCLEKAVQRELLSGKIDDTLCTTQKGMDLNNMLDEILFDF